ncbi:MAG: basic amino acid ABC transporter substrate-binding protein [Desulfovibrio sp.]|nr:MAG: basic amino acid ABC transporter substrate-binding protein [Desulfovibrio sp.]
MKRLSLFALVLAAIVGLCVLAPAQDAQSEDVPTISFGSDCTWPPMEFVDTDHNFVGFSIDLLMAMEATGTFKADINNVAWDNIFAGLAAGQYDCINSSVSITEERQETMDFSDPYFEVKQGVITAQGAGITSVEDLAGKVAGAQLGTTGYFAIEAIEGAEAKSYDEIGLAVEDLYNGNLDAVICDDAVAFDFALQNEKYSQTLTLAFLIESDTPEYLGWAVQKGDPNGVLPILNEALAAVKASGQYDEIFAKWFNQ